VLFHHLNEVTDPFQIERSRCFGSIGHAWIASSFDYFGVWRVIAALDFFLQPELIQSHE